MHKDRVPVSSRRRLLAPGFLVVSALGACVGADKATVRCEPGVGDLSRTVDVAPTNC